MADASEDIAPQDGKAKQKRTQKAKSADGTRKRARRRGAKKVAKAPQVVVSAAELPRRSLEQSLRVAKALRETLAGGPSSWEEIASAMNIGANPQNKYYLWSAVAYGIVEKVDDKYSLSEIGRKILAPTSPNEDREAMVQAVLTPVILSRFFTDYNGSPFPSEEHLGNILERKYGVPRERLREAETIVLENGSYAGILHQQSDGSRVVRLDPRSTGIPQPIDAEAGVPVAVLEAGTSIPGSGEFDKLCFVITPIGDEDSEPRRHANMILKSVIEPVVTELGLVARRADQIDRAGIITQQIFECLAKARLCIADLSFNNPNAFYELGVRHMCKLPTVQIIRKGDKIPFDVSQGRTIKIDMTDVYSVMDSVDSAKKELRQHVRHALSADYKGEDNPVNTYLPGTEVKIPK
jgi:hypothetical protein